MGNRVGVGLLVSLLYWAMWARFQRVSYEYEIRAMLAVEERLGVDWVRDWPVCAIEALVTIRLITLLEQPITGLYNGQIRV